MKHRSSVSVSAAVPAHPQEGYKAHCINGDLLNVPYFCFFPIGFPVFKKKVRCSVLGSTLGSYQCKYQ